MRDQQMSPPPEDDWQPRTGAEQEWEPEDMAMAEGKDPTPENMRAAAEQMAEEGPAAIDKTVP